MKNLVGKKINLELAGLDGNAFFLMGAFQRQAKRENWMPTEIKTVLDEAKAKDYDHLLAVLVAHCEPTDEEYDE